MLDPMPVPLMDVRSQWADVLPRVKAAMLDVVDSGRFILGPNVAAFEREAAAAVGSAHAVGVGNGTDALVLALRALDIGPGDEVICPAYTFFATPETIAGVGATPVFADIRPDDYCLDPEAVEAAVTERTRAVLTVHLFGHPSPMAGLQAVCDRHGLALIEDAAQAFGARLDGQPVGSIGDVATFSFFPTKNLPAFGDGGLVTTGREELAERVRLLRFHGSKDKQTFELVGYNSRLDELQAAVLRVLLPELDGWNAARRRAAARYEELGLGRFVTLPVGSVGGVEPIYHLYMVRSPERDALRAALVERGVSAALYYHRPHHLQPVFAHLGYRPGSLPETERAAAEGLALPMFPTISGDQQREVVAAVEAAVAVTA